MSERYRKVVAYADAETDFTRAQRYDTTAMTTKACARRIAEFGVALLLDVVCMSVSATILWLSHRRACAAIAPDSPSAAPR